MSYQRGNGQVTSERERTSHLREGGESYLRERGDRSPQGEKGMVTTRREGLPGVIFVPEYHF